jgi:hypothetical protein
MKADFPDILWRFLHFLQVNVLIGHLNNLLPPTSKFLFSILYQLRICGVVPFVVFLSLSGHSPE